MSAGAGDALSRRSGHGRPAAPVRQVHLGLGGFFRAHPAYFTARAGDAEDWGIAAFASRRSGLAEALTGQDGLYTLATRRPDDTRLEVIGSVSAVHPAGDAAGWLRRLRSPDTALVTLTVTADAYLRRPDGEPDLDGPAVRADVHAIRTGALEDVTTVPGRLVAGLAARFAVGDLPLALVPCDDLPAGGAAVARVVHALAEQVDPALAEQIARSVSYVTSLADRAVLPTTSVDLALVRERTGLVDRGTVVTEPFSEWVLAGGFPAGRPRWEDSGALLVDDVGPFAHRRRWLRDGALSLLAYAGSIRGHLTVAEAAADPWCRAWVEQWWEDASRHVDQSPDVVARYRDALLGRFENRALPCLLTRIAADGSRRIADRTVPVVRRERRAGRLPLGATRALAAWVLHLRGLGAPVDDRHAEAVVALAGGRLADGARRALGFLDAELAEDTAVVSAVVAQTEELARL